MRCYSCNLDSEYNSGVEAVRAIKKLGCAFWHLNTAGVRKRFPVTHWIYLAICDRYKSGEVAKENSKLTSRQLTSDLQAKAGCCCIQMKQLASRFSTDRSADHRH
jgi:hypothetical protein